MPRAVWACTATVKRPPRAAGHPRADVQRHMHRSHVMSRARGVPFWKRMSAWETRHVGEAVSSRLSSMMPAPLRSKNSEICVVFHV